MTHWLLLQNDFLVIAPVLTLRRDLEVSERDSVVSPTMIRATASSLFETQDSENREEKEEKKNKCPALSACMHSESRARRRRRKSFAPQRHERLGFLVVVGVN